MALYFVYDMYLAIANKLINSGLIAIQKIYIFYSDYEILYLWSMMDYMVQIGVGYFLVFFYVV